MAGQIHKCGMCGAPTNGGGIYEPNNDLGQQDAAAAFAILGMAGRMEALELVAEKARIVCGLVAKGHTGEYTMMPLEQALAELAALDAGAGQGE